MLATSRNAVFLGCGLALLAACTPESKGVDVSAVDLVPNGADMAIGFKLDSVRNSPLADPMWGAMQSDPDIAGMATAMQTCEIKLEGMRGMLAGKMDGDDMVIVIEAPGIGNEDAMKCLEKEGAKATGDDAGLQIFETHGDVRRAPQDGGGWLIILNKDAVALVDGPWESEVFDRIAKPDARTKTGPLGPALGRADQGSDMWAAISFDDAGRADLADLPGADGLNDLVLSTDLSAGLSLKAGMGFSDAAKATSFNDGAKGLLEMAKGEMVSAGVPQAAVDSIKLDAADTVVNASMVISAEDLPGLAAMAVQLAG